MDLSVTPIASLTERNREEEGAVQVVRKPLDSKVRGFVLERIAHAKGGLLPSASAPEIIISLLPGFESGKMDYAPREKRKSKHRKMPLTRRTPIGLTPVDAEGWLNAMMQFILYVPGFAEAFDFAPRSFYPIQEFVDRYHLNQQENRTVCMTDGNVLFQFLSLRLPGYSLSEILQYFISLLKPKWTVHKNLSEALKVRGAGDLFVAQSPVKKQIFAELGICYDLDAFIEMRPDGQNVNYIAYVKIEGSWFQCDNERITQIRSDNFFLPLQKGVLSHYKRIALGNTHLR